MRIGLESGLEEFHTGDCTAVQKTRTARVND